MVQGKVLGAEVNGPRPTRPTSSPQTDRAAAFATNVPTFSGQRRPRRTRNGSWLRMDGIVPAVAASANNMAPRPASMSRLLSGHDKTGLRWHLRRGIARVAWCRSSQDPHKLNWTHGLP